MPDISKPTVGAPGWNAAVDEVIDVVNGLAAVATSGSASDLGTGTIPDGRISTTIARPSAFGDPSGSINGTPTALSNGQAVTVFGNAPLTVTDGRYKHVPFAGANSAGYIQAQLTSRVRRIGASMSWAVGANGAVVLALPAAPWTDTPVETRGPAGVHLVLYGNGIWHCSYFSGTEVKYLRYETHGRFADCRDGKIRDVEVTIDPDRNIARIILPDGKVVTGTDSHIGTDTSTYAVWELYESNGVGTTPGELSLLWAYDRVESGRGGVGPEALARVASDAALGTVPNPRIGDYFFPNAPIAPTTGTPPTNGDMRMSPWLVRRPITLDRLAAEVTTAGEAGSKVRLGIYSDSGECRPGALVVDGGTIAGDVVAVASVTVAVTLQPGLYWLAIAAQDAPTTRPTLRYIGTGMAMPIPVGIATVLSAMSNLSNQGFYATGVTAALPSSVASPIPAAAGGLARMIARCSA